MKTLSLNETTYYKALTGSRQFGINTDCSDTDYIVITTNPIKLLNERAKYDDLHCFRPQMFVYLIFDDERHLDTWRALYALFSQPVADTEFSKWFVANREQIIKANLPRFSTIFLEYIKHVSAQGSNKMPLGEQFPKRIIKSMIFLDAYIRYATENISFEDCFNLSEEFKEYLINVRHKIIPFDTQMEKLNLMLKQAEEVKGFYNKEPDMDTFYKLKHEMESALGLRN